MFTEHTKVLLTGASGFLGQVIEKSLKGIEVTSLGRKDADIIVDISKSIPAVPFTNVVIHAAGKAHSIPRTEQQRKDFFAVNSIGTSNLLQGLQNAGVPEAFIFISSVAVYGLDAGLNIPESHPLGAKDAYGKSKVEAEQMIQTWCKQNNVKCAILRLPLVAGANPPGNLKSMINGIKGGYYFNIAGGNQKRSVVMANDVAFILEKAAEVGGIYNLTDRYNPNFNELSHNVAMQLNKSNIPNMPLWIASILARIGDVIGHKFPINSHRLSKIAKNLTFDDSKAIENLGWDPSPVLKDFKIF